jgi:hypothetical protein
MREPRLLIGATWDAEPERGREIQGHGAATGIGIGAALATAPDAGTYSGGGDRAQSRS